MKSLQSHLFLQALSLLRAKRWIWRKISSEWRLKELKCFSRKTFFIWIARFSLMSVSESFDEDCSDLSSRDLQFITDHSQSEIIKLLSSDVFHVSRLSSVLSWIMMTRLKHHQFESSLLTAKSERSASTHDVWYRDASNLLRERRSSISTRSSHWIDIRYRDASHVKVYQEKSWTIRETFNSFHEICSNYSSTEFSWLVKWCSLNFFLAYS